MTNATKAQISALINAVLVAIVTFGVGLSDRQIGAIMVVTNAALSAWVSMTYKNSSKRVPDSEPGPG